MLEVFTNGFLCGVLLFACCVACGWLISSDVYQLQGILQDLVCFTEHSAFGVIFAEEGEESQAVDWRISEPFKITPSVASTTPDDKLFVWHGVTNSVYQHWDSSKLPDWYLVKSEAITFSIIT